MGKTDSSADSDVTVLLAEASQVGPELDEATELLNKGISAAEDQIARLKLGVSASVKFPLPADDADDVAAGFLRYLVFGKLGDKWRLLVEHGLAGEPNSWSTTPLLNANKEMRLKAVDHFEELLAALLTEAARQRNEIMTKATKALKFASSVATASVSAVVAPPSAGALSPIPTVSVKK